MTLNIIESYRFAGAIVAHAVDVTKGTASSVPSEKDYDLAYQPYNEADFVQAVETIKILATMIEELGSKLYIHSVRVGLGAHGQPK